MAESRYVEVNNLEVGDYVTVWDVDGEYGRQTVMAVDDLKYLPTADVAEIVRCADCRYAPSGTDNGEERGFGLEWPDGDLYKCPFMCDDGWYSRKPRPDFFCANGERKRNG